MLESLGRGSWSLLFSPSSIPAIVVSALPGSFLSAMFGMEAWKSTGSTPSRRRLADMDFFHPVICVFPLLDFLSASAILS
jgi:hypothetical protein